MKKIIIALVLLITFIPRALNATEPQVAIITRVGAPVPFTGVLLSDEAYAKLVTDAKTSAEKEKNKCALDKALELNALKLSTATLAIALQEQKRTFDDRISNRNQIILDQDKKIAKLDEKSGFSDGQKILWLGLGVATAVATAIAVVYAKKVD